MSDVVGPIPTESEMSHIRSLFERAANAIVKASELGQRLSELERHMEQLQRDLEQVKATNAWLSEQLGATRVERDHARKELSEVKQEISVAKTTLENRNATIAAQQETIAHQKDVIARIERESDEHLLRAMQAEEERDAFKSELDEVLEWADEVAKKRRPKEVKEPEAFQSQPSVEEPADVPSPEPLSYVAPTPTMVEELRPHEQEVIQQHTGTEPKRYW